MYYYLQTIPPLRRSGRCGCTDRQTDGRTHNPGTDCTSRKTARAAVAVRTDRQSDRRTDGQIIKGQTLPAERRPGPQWPYGRTDRQTDRQTDGHIIKGQTLPAERRPGPQWPYGQFSSSSPDAHSVSRLHRKCRWKSGQ